MTTQRYDVAVIGAGPGGSAAAYFLAQQGLNVILLDKADFPRPKTCGDGLTPRALGVLAEMGVLDTLHQEGFRINGIHLRAAPGITLDMPIPSKNGLPDYLLILPRLALDAHIQARAVAAGAHFQGQTNVTGIEYADRRVSVVCNRGDRTQRIPARLVVIATGAQMKLLKRLGILPATPPVIRAARTYYRGVSGLTDQVQAHFDNIPLPGYGWVFPISESEANIGLGYWPHGWRGQRMPKNVRQAFDRFVSSPPLRTLLAEASPTGPVKGYPIRIDFPTAPTTGERCLLVGEAAGLVNPLTGEGIDFALESGKLAAVHIAGMFADDDFSPQRLRAYDQVLRQHFQRLFVFLSRIRSLYINPLLVKRFVRMAARVPDLSDLLVNILLGHQDAAAGVSPRTIRQVLLGR